MDSSELNESIEITDISDTPEAFENNDIFLNEMELETIDDGEVPFEEAELLAEKEQLDKFTEDLPPTLSEALEDDALFTEHPSGEYTYSESDIGKKAFGSLELADDPERNAYAQRTVGGTERKLDDDGGHLLGARFGGEGGLENLEAQNSQLNRGEFRQQENEWAKSVKDGNKVFVNVESYRSDGSDRPSAFMGYSVTEHPNGSREWDTFSYENMSRAEAAGCGAGLDDVPDEEEFVSSIQSESEGNDMSYNN